MMEAVPFCQCCERLVPIPYNHRDEYEYCQECYDSGCGDPWDSCEFTLALPAHMKRTLRRKRDAAPTVWELEQVRRSVAEAVASAPT